MQPGLRLPAGCLPGLMCIRVAQAADCVAAHCNQLPGQWVAACSTHHPIQMAVAWRKAKPGQCCSSSAGTLRGAPLATLCALSLLTSCTMLATTAGAATSLGSTEGSCLTRPCRQEGVRGPATVQQSVTRIDLYAGHADGTEGSCLTRPSRYGGKGHSSTRVAVSDKLCVHRLRQTEE